MLTIEIKVNGRLVAGATAANVSDLRVLSDYEVEMVEEAPGVADLPGFHHTTKISRHVRRQSVWSLVEKIASKAARCRATGVGDTKPRERS